MKDIVVIKLGGNALQSLTDIFYTKLRELQNQYGIIIVHGGGPQLDEMLGRLHIKTSKQDGIRITPKETMEVVSMVLAGSINKEVVCQLQKEGIKAVGLSGCDGELLCVTPLNKEQFGYVGELQSVNVPLLESLLQQGMIPVIAPIGVDRSYDRFNINADSAAAGIASFLQAKQLFFFTDVPGIMEKDTLLTSIDKGYIHTLMGNGTLAGGMIPKVEAALKAIDHHVQEVCIISCLAKYQKGIGTTITKGVNVQ
ncbi:acetylglutamate kinase [Priestia taiwanensis]|uniref:Acetylglutamate kinase n=1 Tax=Priestia taiwanensis TaxID=1347902 RepID=A0A917AVX8_9BACI|nr:acetylglutamate kinase [Priestia taiwanensis]MBM7363513.1 acetylglutamate kinase [Priestia taiwanensis]GGE76507.1 acetylglutamate kinase [Priestia taiwanensis]